MSLNPRYVRAKLVTDARALPPGFSAAIAFAKAPQSPQMKPGRLDEFEMVRFSDGQPRGGSASLRLAEWTLSRGGRVVFAFDDRAHARRVLKNLRAAGVQ